MRDTAMRVADAARRSGASWALLTEADSVCYATGLVPDVETGVSPFTGGPPAVLVAPDGSTVLIASEREAEWPGRSVDGLVAYASYSFERSEPAVAHRSAAFARALRELRVAGVVAVELRSLTSADSASLLSAGLGIVPIDRELAVARAVKTSRELELLRESGRVAAIGQIAAVAAAKAGMSELELFAALRLAMEEQAGGRIPIAGDLVSGIERTAAVGGWPSGRRLEQGDPIIADLAPRVAGYWADSCGTFVVGDATPGLRSQFRAAKDALDAGLDALRPGIRAHELDRRIRSVVERAGYSFPHHTGHGIGASVHEYPRIVADETAEIEEGMVILLEPGAYTPDAGGVRLEWMLEVTSTGPRLLTQFDHLLEPQTQE